MNMFLVSEETWFVENSQEYSPVVEGGKLLAPGSWVRRCGGEKGNKIESERVCHIKVGLQRN